MLTNSARCSGDVIKSAIRKHACAWWRYAAACGACARTTT
jgi:alkylated DNA nucleotide flippase Atl1